MLLVTLMAKKLLKRFMKNNYKTQIKESLESKKKIIKRKADTLYIKWKGYGSSFNNSIDQKNIV